jgi:hypothetical protein
MYDMLLGSGEEPNRKSDWYFNDSLENLNKNIDKFPDWRWRNEPFSYEFNEYGYRMKDVHQIDWDNYFIALGCSVTMGMGLPVNLSWPGLVSDELNMDVVNLGKTGSGPEFVFYNIMHCIDKLPNLPKFIAIAWPPLYRLTWFKNENLNPLKTHIYHWKITPVGHKTLEYCQVEEDISKMYSRLDDMDHHLLQRWEYMRKAIKLIDVPIIEMSFFKDYKNLFTIEVNESKLSQEYILNNCRARDIQDDMRSHPGPLYHQIAKDYVLECLK